MMSLRPKQLVRLEMTYLEEGVLDVLLAAKHRGERLTATAVRKQAGIYQSKGDRDNNAIAYGVLHKLVKAGRVQRYKEGGKRERYELTEAEFEARRDDL